MKLLTSLLVAGLITAKGASQTENPTVIIIISGQGVHTKTSGFVSNERTLIPLRPIASSLGATISQDGPSISIDTAERKVLITIASRAAYIDGVEMRLDQPACIHRGRAYVPLRFVGEAFGATVQPASASQPVLVSVPSSPAFQEPSMLRDEVAILPIVFAGAATEGGMNVAVAQLPKLLAKAGWNTVSEANVRHACDTVFGRTDPDSEAGFHPTASQLLEVAKSLNVRYVLFVAEEYSVWESRVDAKADILFIDSRQNAQHRLFKPFHVEVRKGIGPVDPACRRAASELSELLLDGINPWLAKDERIDKN